MTLSTYSYQRFKSVVGSIRGRAAVYFISGVIPAADGSVAGREFRALAVIPGQDTSVLFTLAVSTPSNDSYIAPATFHADFPDAIEVDGF